jgi:DNA-binding NarL/FixJ family response regulator
VVLIIDQHGVYRSGIRELIEAKVRRSRVVEASGLGDLAAGQFFDLILVDVECLSQRLLEYLKEVHELTPETRFAVMSSSGTRADVLNCLSAGFHGFVYKLQSDQGLIIAINDLLSGRIYVPGWLADGDYEGTEIPPSANLALELPKLTRRQNEILPLIAQGMSNKEIALHLNIAEGTTKIHTAALLHALGARNRTEAAFMAAKVVGSGRRVEDRFKNQRFMIKGLNGSAERLRATSR